MLGLGVGCDQAGTNFGDTRRVGRHELLPQLLVTSGELKALDFGRQLADRVGIEVRAVAAPAYRRVSCSEPGDRFGFTSSHGIKVSATVGANPGHLLAVPRDHKLSRRCALGGDRAPRAGVNLLHINAHAVSLLTADKQVTPA